MDNHSQSDAPSRRTSRRDGLRQSVLWGLLSLLVVILSTGIYSVSPSAEQVPKHPGVESVPRTTDSPSSSASMVTRRHTGVQASADHAAARKAGEALLAQIRSEIDRRQETELNQEGIDTLKVLQRCHRWLEHPDAQGRWRQEWYPPTNQVQPMLLRAFSDRAAWESLRARAAKYDLILDEDPSSEAGGVAMLRRTVKEFMAHPQSQLFMEFQLDERLTGTELLIAACFFCGSSDPVLKLTPFMLLHYHDAELALAVFAFELGGAQTPLGPG